MAKLKLNKESLDLIQKHATETYPFECCGFFYGNEGEIRDIKKALKVDNSKNGDQRRRFEINAQDYLEAEKYALSSGLDLLGVYHSHPDHPPLPSVHDLKQALPFFSYIIVAVKKGVVEEIKSWQLNDKNEFEQEQILNN